MTSTETVASLASFGATIIGVIWVYRFWRQHWVDEFRNDLFQVRDRAFFYAADHNLLQQHAYREFRQRLNSLIRYGHKISFGRVILLLAADEWFTPPVDKDIRSSHEIIGLLPREHVKHFQDLQNRVEFLIIRQIVKSSITLRVIIALVGIGRWFLGEGNVDIPKDMARRVPLGRLEKDAACYA